MTFDPTFHEIDEEAADLPDLDGDLPEPQDAGDLLADPEADDLPAEGA
ncbi:hypothetical protein ACTU3I_10620 [Microbacterium sp. RD1]